jgi:hypothetical protein
MGKGGVSDSERMRRLAALTSIAPVARFSLTPPERASTLPVTAMTNSLLSFSAFVKLSVPQSHSSKIICKIPLLSLRSTKIMPPLFLLFCTHPMTVTVSPTLAVLSSVHLWDRFSPIIDSAMISSISVSGLLVVFLPCCPSVFKSQVCDSAFCVYFNASL